jgi:hypothetical protein
MSRACSMLGKDEKLVGYVGINRRMKLKGC